MESKQQTDRKKLLRLLALGLGGALALGVALLLGVDLRALLKQGLDLISQAGPLAFFISMALLPAFGVPMLAFVLPVGALFGERLGMPAVFGYSIAALTFNMLLTYSLARWTLRPLLTGLVARLGYRLPEVEGSDATDLLVILRVTPGIPFFVQNYMSGLADIPLRSYLLISCLIAWSYNAAFVFFGNALLHGQGRLVLMAVGAIAALVASLHMVRRHYASKRKTA